MESPTLQQSVAEVRGLLNRLDTEIAECIARFEAMTGVRVLHVDLGRCEATGAPKVEVEVRL